MSRKLKTHILVPEPDLCVRTFCGVSQSPHMTKVSVYKLVDRIPCNLCGSCWNNFQKFTEKSFADKIFRDRVIEAGRHLYRNNEILQRFFTHRPECQCWQCLGAPSPECEEIIEKIAEYFRTNCDRCRHDPHPHPCMQCLSKAEYLYRETGLGHFVKKAEYGIGWTGWKR